MSLINDALKKAQRQRADPMGASTPPMPGGGTRTRVQKRGEPMRAQTILVLGGMAVGGVVVVILLVIFIIRANTRGHATAQAANAAASGIAAPHPTPPAAVAVAPAPIIAAPTPIAVAAAPAPRPVVTRPAVAATGNPAVTSKPPAPTRPTAGVATSAPAPIIVGPVVTTPAAQEPASGPYASPAPPPVSAGLVQTDPRVYSFLDTIHVTGIRSSGNESRVLMSEHVYRVGDVVDHLLGIKLVKVGVNTLTFTDAAGAVYVKNF